MKHNYTNEELNKTGIYKITCLSNNKIYIGSAASIRGTGSRKGFNVLLKTIYEII